MNITVISCSLNPESNSRKLAQFAFNNLQELPVTAHFINLQDYNLPICDGDATCSHPDAAHIADTIRSSHGIILATPVYNFNVSSSAKNLIELTGKAWNNKVVGFLCAAGGQHAYMGVMPLANSLMLDFRCVVMPNFVYANEKDFDDQNNPHSNIQQRIHKLLTHTLAFAKIDVSH